MMRIITRKRLRAYAEQYPSASASLEHWEKITLAADWTHPADVKNTFRDADPVQVASGNTVYVFNIERNRHRLVAAIHFNTEIVYVLRIMTHQAYDRNQWKVEL